MRRESAPFERLLEDYFDAVLADHPMYATVVGLKSGEGKLGRTDSEFQARQERRRQRTLTALNHQSPVDLSREQHLDRLALRSQIMRESEDYARGRHEMDPSAIDQVLGIILHELIRGEDEPKRAARNLRALLEKMPDYLNEAATVVLRPDPIWRRIMVESAAGAPALFKAVGTFLERNGGLHTDPTRLAAAEKAVANYREAVLDRPAAAEGSFALGAEGLQRRVRDDLGLDYTLQEIESLASGEVKRIGGLLDAACRKVSRGKGPDEVLSEARARWEPGGDLLEVYRKETTRIADAFRSANAVSFPAGDVLDVRPVPEFMRPLFPTAAYTAPGAFEKTQKGIFWVNDLSLTKATEEEKRAERAQHFGLSLTCAHEAYPGHHLQFVTANGHARKWRRLFSHAVFYEGWTLWCEQMMVDLKIERSPWLLVQQLHDALWRCHRILVDLRLHTRRYTYEQAVRHMQKHLGFTRGRAEADVNWYTGQPGVPMSYWLGRLENERLRDRLIRRREWSLRQFNDWLLSFGTLPQSWIEKYGLD